MGKYNGDGGTPTLGGLGGPPHFTWDAPSYAVPGIYEEDIATNEVVQPKLKHWYQGDFPAKLSGINWMIKTMDKPKIEVESVEQMRNNVIRNYPVKYSFGDVSLTFWDDIAHKTIKTITEYFQGSVWTHADRQSSGEMLLRDSVVIPEFSIIEYTTDDQSPITWTFWNAVLSSYDLDATDDDGDDSIYTVQLVLKIEGYKLTGG